MNIIYWLIDQSNICQNVHEPILYILSRGVDAPLHIMD